MSRTNTITAAMIGRQGRVIVLIGLVFLAILAWAWNIHLARNMGPIPMEMPGMEVWTAGDLTSLWMMWSAMMVAMMLPSVSPTVLTFAAMEEKKGDQARVTARTSLFLVGYLSSWIAFCVLATAAQWRLHSATLLSPMMVSTSARFSGVILILAGIFQWSPFKHKCLSHCRSPIGFLLTEWREGLKGSTEMGFRHGTYCIGCCWLLMALLFVVGVMNLVWVAFLSAIVLIERVFPRGDQIAKFSGILLIAWGAWLLI